MLSEDKETDFVIDPRNGTIFSNRMLDRETRSAYNLVVLAKDKAKYPQQRLTATVQVRICHASVCDMDDVCVVIEWVVGFSGNLFGVVCRNGVKIPSKCLARW